VTHSAPAGAEDEEARLAVFAFVTSNGGCAEAGYSVSYLHCLHIFANFYNGPGEFVSQDDWGIVAECVMQYVEICTANSTEGDLDLDLSVTTCWLRHETNLYISVAAGILDYCLHRYSSTFRSARLPLFPRSLRGQCLAEVPNKTRTFGLRQTPKSTCRAQKYSSKIGAPVLMFGHVWLGFVFPYPADYCNSILSE
jgi:hypothetical protein